LNISSQSTQPDAQYVQAESKGYAVNLKPLLIEPSKAPDFKGLGLRDALQIAKQIPVKISFEGYGKVSNQSISAGTTVSPSNTIHLKLSPIK